MAPLPPVYVLFRPLAAYGDDTVAGFEQAARLRYDEATALLGGFPSGAVYLCGYCVEATLKAAWFRWIGHAPQQPITDADWAVTADLASQLGLRLGRTHNLAGWARWLVASRLQVASYPAALEQGVLANVDLVHQYWAPNLRYRGSVISPADATAVHAAAAWVLTQYPNL